MDVIEAINKRRSVRRYKEDPLPEDVLNGLLEAARMAPSAGNVQPWYFKVIRRPQTKEALAAAALNQRWMVKAPVIIAVCADRERAARSYGRRGEELYALLDSAVAVYNIMLAATAAGLGTCWVGAFDDHKVSQILGVDGQRKRPVALIPVGYPDEQPSKTPRRPLSEMVEYVD